MNIELSTWLVVGGLLLLATEIILLGFGTFVLLFLGLALLVSGLLIMGGLIPDTLAAATWSTGISAVVITAVLWKPLRNMQSKEPSAPESNSGDFANDVEFELDADVSLNGGTQYRYSGIDWKVKSKTPLVSGTRVRVVRKEVGVFWVEPSPD